MFVRSDAGQLKVIVARVDSGAVRIDVSVKVPLSDIALVHERSAAGKLRGRVLLIPQG
jgi:NADPH:quinone reductase-like Zn-dependent oxidoreductase